MSNQTIPPHLLEKLFDDRKTSKTLRLFWGGIKYLLSFSAIFIIFFIIFNFPAFYARAKFTLNPPEIVNQPEIVQPINLGLQTQPEPEIQTPKIDNNRLIIAKLGIDVPAIWDVPFEQIVPRLADGVVHYGGTALPGQNGNVFITGHSSNFWWDKGKFNTIFANLGKLEIGDEISASYENTQYRYIVEKKFVVDPSRIEVLNPSDHSIISIMTCTPVGTTINRLIVQARQVEPEPGAAAKTDPPVLPDKLPAIR